MILIAMLFQIYYKCKYFNCSTATANAFTVYKYSMKTYNIVRHMEFTFYNSIAGLDFCRDFKKKNINKL